MVRGRLLIPSNTAQRIEVHYCVGIYQKVMSSRAGILEIYDLKDRFMSTRTKNGERVIVFSVGNRALSS